MTRVPSKGWFGTVTHPDTARILRAEPLADPQITPSFNALPRIDLPVPRSPTGVWRDLEGEPAFAVYRDGAEQPIDELQDVREARDRVATVLRGRGGVELLTRVDEPEEYNIERRHVAAEALINDHTTYDADVPTPTFGSLTGETMQAPTSTSDFNAILNPQDTDPTDTSSNEVKNFQSLYWEDAQDASGGTFTANADFESQEGRRLDLDAKITFSFTFDYVLPTAQANQRLDIPAPDGVTPGSYDGHVPFWILFDDGVVGGAVTAGALTDGVRWFDDGDTDDLDTSSHTYALLPRPTVAPVGVDSVSDTTATLRGEVVSFGSGESAETVRVLVGEDPVGSPGDVVLNEIVGSFDSTDVGSEFTHSVSGLDPSTTYQFAFWIEHSRDGLGFPTDDPTFSIFSGASAPDITFETEAAGGSGGDATDTFSHNILTFDVDVFTVRDTRWSYTFDNATDGNDLLDGPELYPDGFDTVFRDQVSAFVVEAATITLTIDDTTGDQRVQLSNDQGDTWKPDDGTEDNTATVTVDPFPGLGNTVRTRVTLDRHSPQGARAESPKFGYASQTISDFEITADLRQEALLLDETFDDTVDNILTEIAGDQFFWSYRMVDGVKTVTFIQPGARTASDDPELLQAETTKELETIHKITVRGANRRVSAERFSGSVAFVSLNQSTILPGSETVYDPDDGTPFERGPDYVMDWTDGEIRIVASGDMDAATTYAIDYRYEVQGTYEDPDAPAGFRERVVDIPAVTSVRNAEQIAFVLVDDLNVPRWVAEVTVPPGATSFNAVEALTLDRLGLPAGAGPFEVVEPPQVTPEGTSFVLGTRRELEDRLIGLNDRVRQVARRSG